MSNEKRLWIIEARDGAWGANGICKGELVRCGQCKHGSKCLLDVVQCKMYGYKHQADWFCADGERRTL